MLAGIPGRQVTARPWEPSAVDLQRGLVVFLAFGLEARDLFVYIKASVYVSLKDVASHRRAVSDHVRGLKITPNNWALNLTAFPKSLKFWSLYWPWWSLPLSRNYPSEFQDPWWRQEIAVIAKHCRTRVLLNLMGWEGKGRKESSEREKRRN